MINLKTKQRVKVPRTKRYKKLRSVAILNILLLLFNIFSYYWISGPGVLDIQAADVGLCMKICAQGEDDCGNLTAAQCAELISPTPTEPEEEEEEEVVEEETTVVPSAAVPISPITTPIGLVSQEQIGNALVLAESAVPIYNEIKTINITFDTTVDTAIDMVSEVDSIPVVANEIPVIPASASSGGGSLLTFQGKTNIKNAIIIITLTSPQTFYATTRADDNGNWDWTPPENLLPGKHRLVVMAMSPSNAQIRQVYEMRFYVEAPLEEVAPAEPDISEPEAPESIIPGELLPPEKLSPIEITKDIYILDLEVVPEEERIQPGSEISLVAEVASLNPIVEEEVTLVFTINKNPNGRLIFKDKDILTLKDRVSVIKRLELKKTIEPGNYIATVQLTKKDITYLTSVGFIVKEKETESVVLLPGGIIVRQTEAQKGLFTSFIFLSLLLFFFVLLLWREYQQAKREVQITGRDLWRDGQIA